MSDTITVEVADSTDSRHGKAQIPKEATVEQVQEALVQKFDLPKFDNEGRPVSYHLRNARTGQNLSSSDTVSQTMDENDQIQLLPEITPG